MGRAARRPRPAKCSQGRRAEMKQLRNIVPQAGGKDERRRGTTYGKRRKRGRIHPKASRGREAKDARGTRK
ncbi:MAG: hypothetical protein BLITH_0880 [Brockia lithotrophica]|uniref:Uncharacterized protein n=1 Tax=Brockia lithotrophica TaxID=933949 RepID=A0A2T5G932_9BACL|nr:MAG: hypothetical protein BLITH_0880 [Brockia lithotrophica]